MDKGYGVVLECYDGSDYVENASVKLCDMILASKCDWLKELYVKFCEENGFEHDDMEAKEEFVNQFEIDFIGDGFEGLLAEFINESEYEGRECFVYRDGCLYVSAQVPVDEDDKAFLPTQKDIQKVLDKYLAPMLRGLMPQAMWLDVNY